MKSREISRTILQRAAARSTRDSAVLERREVPRQFQRSERVEQFLAAKRRRS